MTLPLERSKTATNACRQFEADLHAFVDGELETLDDQRVASHVESCSSCHGYVQQLTQLGRMHRHTAGVEMDPEALLESFDSQELFGDLTRKLLGDAEDQLAKLLYELGKSLIAAANASTPQWRSQTMYETEPQPIATLTRKGRQVAREYAQLSRKVPARRRRSSMKAPTRGLFQSRTNLHGGAAFESGRACLEECLSLRKDSHEARIFLAHYHRKVGRLDRARQQLQIVQRARGVDAKTRLLATHQLSRVYSSVDQFARALEMEREVLVDAGEQKHELLQVGALTNIAMYAVKLGRWEEAEEAIDRLVQTFPERIEDVAAPAFAKAQEFRRVLVEDGSHLTQWKARFPQLFGGVRERGDDR